MYHLGKKILQNFTEQRLIPVLIFLLGVLWGEIGGVIIILCLKSTGW